MFTSRQRLIALNIDVHISLDRLRDLMDAIGAAAMLGRSHAAGPAVPPQTAAISSESVATMTSCKREQARAASYT
jgi:hypothetical protein